MFDRPAVRHRAPRKMGVLLRRSSHAETHPSPEYRCRRTDPERKRRHSGGGKGLLPRETSDSVTQVLCEIFQPSPPERVVTVLPDPKRTPNPAPGRGARLIRRHASAPELSLDELGVQPHLFIEITINLITPHQHGQPPATFAER